LSVVEVEHAIIAFGSAGRAEDGGLKGRMLGGVLGQGALSTLLTS